MREVFIVLGGREDLARWVCWNFSDGKSRLGGRVSKILVGVAESIL